MANRRWWHGLQARVTLAYAFGALLLSATIAFSSFSVAQNRLLAEEEQQTEERFFRNAAEVRRELEAIPPDAEPETKSERYATLVESGLRRTDAAGPVLDPPGEAATVGVAANEIPSEFEAAVLDNNLADYRFEGTENTLYLVGINLMGLDAQYYEVVSLAELENTLADLRRILFAAAGAASLAGAALGYYSSRRALAPVTRVSNAAQAIAAGDLSTRLDLQVDPDLAVLSQSFNEMSDALAVRIARDERFTSDVSHELRSPLMTLTASVEVLERRKSSLPDVAQKAVELLRQDLTRFEHLVEDLLEISRMDAGAVQLQLSRFGLTEFLINVIAQSRSPEIELHHPNRDRGLTITADKRRLAQVVTNLIDNAKKYGGGASGISFRRVGHTVQLVIEDLGPGVPPADRKRIFDRFSRSTSDAGRRGSDSGVGLGLSLVAEHVRLHGGRVWVTDRVDGRSGARFVVELPVGEYEDEMEEMAV